MLNPPPENIIFFILSRVSKKFRSLLSQVSRWRGVFTGRENRGKIK
jgi:hypothetical protein